MRERIIRIPLLILLLLLNLGLLIANVNSRIQRYSVSPQEMEQVQKLYEDSGIDFKAQPSMRGKQRSALEIGPADLDAMVQEFLGDREYSLTYIYGAKTQYNAGSTVLIADWDSHSISYRDTEVVSEDAKEPWRNVLTEEEQLMLETVAMRFAQRWMGENVLITSWTRSGDTLTVNFAQMEDQEVYYFNSMQVVVLRGGIQSAELSYWKVLGSGETVDAMPMDEMLYRALDAILYSEHTRAEEDTVNDILDGYSLETVYGDRGLAMPTMTMIMESGKQFVLSYCHE